MEKLKQAYRRFVEEGDQDSTIISLERGSERFPWKKVALVVSGMAAGIFIGIWVGAYTGELIDAFVKYPGVSFQDLGYAEGAIVGGLLGAVTVDKLLFG